MSSLFEQGVLQKSELCVAGAEPASMPVSVPALVLMAGFYF